MKMVKISEYLYLNSDFIESVEADSEESVIITMTSGAIFSPYVPIKKVLDAISGSEEHLINNADMKILKSKSITSGHLNQSFDRF